MCVQCGAADRTALTDTLGGRGQRDGGHARGQTAKRTLTPTPTHPHSPNAGASASASGRATYCQSCQSFSSEVGHAREWGLGEEDGVSSCFRLAVAGGRRVLDACVLCLGWANEVGDSGWLRWCIGCVGSLLLLFPSFVLCFICVRHLSRASWCVVCRVHPSIKSHARCARCVLIAAGIRNLVCFHVPPLSSITRDG